VILNLTEEFSVNKNIIKDYSRKISERMWNLPDKGELESHREETYIDDIIQKSHIERKLLDNLEGIDTVFDKITFVKGALELSAISNRLPLYFLSSTASYERFQCRLSGSFAWNYSRKCLFLPVRSGHDRRRNAGC